MAELNVEDRQSHRSLTEERIGQSMQEAGEFNGAAEVYRQAENSRKASPLELPIAQAQRLSGRSEALFRVRTIQP